MNIYTVIGKLASIGAGRVKLDDDQARTRRHNLKHIDADVFEIVNPIQFKHGQQFGYQGEIDNVLKANLAEIESGSRVDTDPSAEAPTAARKTRR